jgi:hypothetical protein
MAAQQTTAERTEYRATSSYNDVVAFLDSLERRTSDIRRWSLGRSPEGREIPLLLVSRPLVDGPAAAYRSGKPVIYLQANIHAGEVEGKEAVLALVRDLTTGQLRPLLDSLILLVVPIYNADGNERLKPGEQNRPGQNGPAMVGVRANGQGLDLNRDYVKLEAPETRGALALLNQWDPDLFIDLHTTNGSYHGYLLTFSPGLNPNSPASNDYVRDRFLPTVRQRMRQRHRQETFWYGNFRNQTPDSLTQGWETYDPRPRFGTNLVGMRARLSILSEAYSNAPFRDRVLVTYNFVREVLALAAEQREQIRALNAAGERFAPDSVVVRSVLAPPTEQDVIAELTEPAGDGAGPFASRRRTGVFRTIRMPVYDRFAAAKKEARPAGYLIPATHAHVIEALARQGVLLLRLRAPAAGRAEAFTIDSVTAARNVFEGHRNVSVTGRWVEESWESAAGTYYVSGNQRLGVLATYLLEPTSEDGLVSWNFFDRDLRPGGVYPIRRIRAPLVGDLDAVPEFSSP